MTDESAEHGADAVSHIVPGDAEAEAHVLVVAYKGAVEVASQAWHYAPAGGDDFTNAQIGDEIGGGIYGGTHTNGTETWHVIFAKQAGESAEGPIWGNIGTETGATDHDDGLANQNLILASFDDGSADAFYYCRDYVDAEGNNDYYLPARNELALVDALVNMSHPEFQSDMHTYLWSSTEDSAGSVWFRWLPEGYGSYDYKGSTDFRVRPVRRVPVEV